MKKTIKNMWRQGRNVWEISQLTGISESRILEVVNGK